MPLIRALIATGALIALWTGRASGHALAVAPAAPAAALRWTFDPGVVLPWLVTAVLYVVGLRRLWRRPSPLGAPAALAFAGGMTALAAALVSPLHALGGVLFTAHMVQHEILMVVAAPLVILGRPGLVLRAALPAAVRRPLARVARAPVVRGAATLATAPLAAWTLHAAALWLWHVPALFGATLRSDVVHALQHASFFGSALLFWMVVLAPERAGPSLLVRLLAVFTTSVHGAILGALLTFARTPWYPAYAASTRAFGLTPLEDQQLGGLVMWVPAGLVYVAAALVLAGRALAGDERPAARLATAARTALVTLLLVVATAPRAAAATPAPRVYVSNERAGTITVIDSGADRVIATWDVGGRPRGIRVTPDGRRVLTAVSDPIGGNPAAPAVGIAALDAATGAVVARYAVGSDPEQFAITPDGHALYASNEDAGTATAIALPDGGTLATLVTGTEPEGVVASPDGTRVYVTAETSNTVTVVDTRRRAVAATFLVDARPRDAAFTRDGARAYVTAEVGGTVSVVDVAKSAVTDTIALPAGARPAGVRVAPDGRTLYVATGRGNTIAIIDAARRSVVATVPVGQRVWGLGLTSDGRKLYAANGLSNDVSVIDTARRAVVATIAAGDGPWGVAVGR